MSSELSEASTDFDSFASCRLSKVPDPVRDCLQEAPVVRCAEYRPVDHSTFYLAYCKDGAVRVILYYEQTGRAVRVDNADRVIRDCLYREYDLLPLTARMRSGFDRSIVRRRPTLTAAVALLSIGTLGWWLIRS